jgi:hypothetical protein
LEKLGLTIELSHVKGHQDDKIPYKDLPREAQLNVQADALCTNQLNEPADPAAGYRNFSANPTSLLINGEYITAKYTKCLRSAYLSQDLRKLMVKNFQWKPTTPELVWWDVHGIALTAMSHNDKMRMQKFNFNWLPTNHRQSQYEAHVEDRCSACSYVNEDDDHVIRCIDVNRQKVRTAWMQELSQFLRELHTPIAVHDAILGGLEAWLEKRQVPNLATLVNDPSRALTRAYKNQTTIGWHHFVRGRIAQDWADLIDHELESNDIEAKVMTTTRWGARMITICWSKVLTLWDTRNTSEHGETAEEMQHKLKTKLMKEAKYLQDSNPEMSHVDRDWFDRDLEELEKTSLSNIYAWLRNSRALIRINKREQKQQTNQRRLVFPPIIGRIKDPNKTRPVALCHGCHLHDVPDAK